MTSQYRSDRANLSSILQQLNNEDDLNSDNFSAAFGLGSSLPARTFPSQSYNAPPVVKPTISQPAVIISTEPHIPVESSAVNIRLVSQHRPGPAVVNSETYESFPATPSPTPNLGNISPTRNPNTESAQHSETELQHLIAQIQIEQSSHELTKKKLDYFSEERALLLKEISTNRFQIDNLNKRKILMTQSLDQHSQNQSKMSNELTKKQQTLEQEKIKLQREIEKEKTAELELTGENSQLKTNLESLNESYVSLSNAKPSLSTTYDNDKNIRLRLESEYHQLRDRSNQIQKELDKERTENVSLAKEVQELKKQSKALESTLNTTEELTSKIQQLEQILNDEQFKRNETEVRFVDLHLRYSDLYFHYTKQFQIIADTLSTIKQKLASFPPEIQTRSNTGH